MSDFGELLRTWRKARGLSQLDLSLQAGVSSRHLSFLETGKSNPSREMIIQIASALDMPLRERNGLLNSAGFSEVYAERSLDAPEMGRIKEALWMIINNNMPFPALVMDRDWNILMGNAAHDAFIEMGRALQPNFPDTSNILELLFSPDGFRPFVANFDELAKMFLRRLHRERLVLNQDSDLLDRLHAMTSDTIDWQSFDPEELSQPLIQLKVKIDNLSLNVFSTLTTFGTALDITLQDLRIESYYPADDDTIQFFTDLTANQ